jgi:16S rRNA (adenine1518-N6/adenine1519-N6)-dimethyltransferase
MAENGKFRTKKSLGQHFLKSASALEAMAVAGEVSKNDTVLEIGPGEGVLTRVLLAHGATVVAVEKDDRLIPILLNTFREEIRSRKLTLIHGDALEFNPTSSKLTAGGYKLIANIPYYITGLLLRTFLESDTPPSTMVLLVQKEVAGRMTTKEGKESLLSVSVKVFGTPKYIKTVPRGAFSPPPKVDSAIIAVTNIKKLPVKVRTQFFEVVRAGFAHPRKRLKKNLEDTASKESIAHAWHQLKLGEDVRSEEVNPLIWKSLAELLTP